MNYDKILIVTDDSPSSLKAAKYGYDLAAKLNAKVALIGVIDEALATGNVDAGIFPEQAAHSLKKNMEELMHNNPTGLCKRRGHRIFCTGRRSERNRVENGQGMGRRSDCCRDPWP